MQKKIIMLSGLLSFMLAHYKSFGMEKKSKTQRIEQDLLEQKTAKLCIEIRKTHSDCTIRYDETILAHSQVYLLEWIKKQTSQQKKDLQEKNKQEKK